MEHDKKTEDSKSNIAIVVAIVIAVIIGAVLLFMPKNNGIAAKSDDGWQLSEDTVTKYVMGFKNEVLDDQDGKSWEEWLKENGMTAKDMRDQAIDYLIEEELIKRLLSENNATPTQEEIDEAYKTERAKNLLSDDEKFQTFLESNNITDDIYREHIRHQLSIDKAQDILFERSDLYAVSDQDILEKTNSLLGDPKTTYAISSFVISGTSKDNAESEHTRALSGHFDELMDKYNGYEDGYTGWSLKMDFMPSDLEDFLSSAKAGEISDIIWINGNTALTTRVDEVYPSSSAPYSSADDIPDAIKKDVTDMIRDEREVEGAISEMKKLKDAWHVTTNSMPGNLPYA